MDNNDTENNEKRNSNTEYVPTKCRVTKPPPPKPATNPLQFVKVPPCPLFQKAHEQIKKVEEIKKERKEVREEAEDWQQNLDNWKSNRRKRQEHIIERVVEVKKFEQAELERSRKKSKTFNEMIEERSRGRHKFNIPIYDDDSNDLSDYGIGSSSSKTNSVKDPDTDDSSSILDEKENGCLESLSHKEENVNQRQSEDEGRKKPQETEKESSNSINESSSFSSSSSSSITSTSGSNNIVNNKIFNDYKVNNEIKRNFENQSSTEQYTYEGAIQDYRSRIRSKIHVDESIFTKNQDYTKSKEFSEAQSAIPKGEICKRKELFEMDKPIEIHTYESRMSRQLSEDFANSQSIKQRLKSLEKCVDLPLKAVDKNDMSIVKQRLQNFNKMQENNNNLNLRNSSDSKNSSPPKISNYLLDKNSDLNNKRNDTSLEKLENQERCSSPEADLYMDKLNIFNKDLDNLMYNKPATVTQSITSNNNGYFDYCSNLNYPPSTSSTELTGTEDSGIHTADVSCSVSQADESVDSDLCSTTIPNCIEQLTIEDNKYEDIPENIKNESNESKILNGDDNNNHSRNYYKESLVITENLLENLRKDSSQNLITPPEQMKKTNQPETVIYENIVLANIETKPVVQVIENNVIIDPLAPPTAMEPPSVKPPPPPPVDEDNDNNEPVSAENMKRMNSTKRIKREIHIKRSSFLGLEEPNDIPVVNIDKPPDINTFLQKESKLEKSLYKKIQEENRMGLLSKVESLDSGLDIDRGRLSSDTWCSSSIGESITPSPERHDSEQANSITSEEDEITKKEREIIEMVEKEEKSRDTVEFNHQKILSEPYLREDNFKNSYYSKDIVKDYLDDQDSEVLKVEHELRQLEKEELERQRDNRLFEESRAKARLQSNRHSLENIFDSVYPLYQDGINYRKSMPELQHIPLEYRNFHSDVKKSYNVYPIPQQNVRAPDMQYRKSMPDLQNSLHHKTSPDYRKPILENKTKSFDHRKSMPDMSLKTPIPLKSQPIIPAKQFSPLNKDQKDRYYMNNSELMPQHNSPKHRQLSRNSLQALSAVPKPRHLQMDNWIQPRANPEVKSYNQHWLYQEAELRRITEQQKNAAANRNIQRQRQDRHLPDTVIQSLTQRVQNRPEINERNQILNNSKDNMQQPQHSYLGHNQTMGHALPMPYAPQIGMEESQDRMLSVSGKKKCSYCANELGRGAAMIIESLCLFYHMECFKCCVCHMQLGDGLMGTDVRVRNQKLHCHNCYSSDDGVKFSCV